MSEIDHTANLILNRNYDENAPPRVNGYYVHLRHLKAMAKLWLMRKEIARLLDTSGSIHGGKGWMELAQKIETLEKE